MLGEVDTGRLKVTAAEIEAGRGPGGGWTRETLESWGVPWPPPKGWKSRLMQGCADMTFPITVTEGGERFYRLEFTWHPALVHTLHGLDTADRQWRAGEKAWFVRRSAMRLLARMFRERGMKIRWSLAKDLPMPSEECERRPCRSPYRTLYLRQSAPLSVVCAAYEALKQEPNIDLDELERAFSFLTEGKLNA